MTLLWFAFSACNLEILPTAPPPPCEREAAWYPPAGTDAPFEVYVGCDPPEGWTTTAPDLPDTAADDTAADDTAAADTGASDTAADDTADTAAGGR